MDTRKIWIKPKDKWITIEYIPDPNKEFTLDRLNAMDATIETPVLGRIVKGLEKVYGNVDKLKVGRESAVDSDDMIISTYEALAAALRERHKVNDALEQEEEDLKGEYGLISEKYDAESGETLRIWDNKKATAKKKREFEKKRTELIQRKKANLIIYREDVIKLQNMSKKYKSAKARKRKIVTPRRTKMSIREVEEAEKTLLDEQSREFGAAAAPAQVSDEDMELRQSSTDSFGGRKKKTRKSLFKKKRTKKRIKNKKRKRKSRKRKGGHNHGLHLGGSKFLLGGGI